MPILADLSLLLLFASFAVALRQLRPVERWEPCDEEWYRAPGHPKLLVGSFGVALAVGILATIVYPALHTVLLAFFLLSVGAYVGYLRRIGQGWRQVGMSPVVGGSMLFVFTVEHGFPAEAQIRWGNRDLFVAVFCLNLVLVWKSPAKAVWSLGVLGALLWWSPPSWVQRVSVADFAARNWRSEIWDSYRGDDALPIVVDRAREIGLSVDRGQLRALLEERGEFLPDYDWHRRTFCLQHDLCNDDEIRELLADASSGLQSIIDGLPKGQDPGLGDSWFRVFDWYPWALHRLSEGDEALSRLADWCDALTRNEIVLTPESMLRLDDLYREVWTRRPPGLRDFVHRSLQASWIGQGSNRWARSAGGFGRSERYSDLEDPATTHAAIVLMGRYGIPEGIDGWMCRGFLVGEARGAHVAGGEVIARIALDRLDESGVLPPRSPWQFLVGERVLVGFALLLVFGFVVYRQAPMAQEHEKLPPWKERRKALEKRVLARRKAWKAVDPEAVSTPRRRRRGEGPNPAAPA